MMSVDKSLKSKSQLKRERNVLTRLERIEKLEDEERWQEGESVFSLPKVKIVRIKRKKAAKPKEEEAAAEGEVTAEGDAAEGEAKPPAE